MCERCEYFDQAVREVEALLPLLTRDPITDDDPRVEHFNEVAVAPIPEGCADSSNFVFSLAILRLAGAYWAISDKPDFVFLGECAGIGLETSMGRAQETRTMMRETMEEISNLPEHPEHN